jgi:phosphonate transport system permease protein
VAPGSQRFSAFIFTVLPGVLSELRSYTSYRFECALRSSAVIGFVGFPTIGYHLESYFNEGYYSETAALFFAFLVIIASRKLWLNKFTMPVIIPTIFFLITWRVGFSLTNMQRFLHDCIPYPIRQALDNGTEIHWGSFGEWLEQMFSQEILPGLWDTLVLTQLSLVATGVLTLLLFPLGCEKFLGKKAKFLGKGLFLFFRTIPEYILAYILILPLGPSMLPGILTISTHNSSILSHLIANSVDFIQLKHDSLHQKVNLYFYEILPRVYGQFLAFLFYRWEIIMRESAILGVLGISTIGFYVDSALHEQRFDRVMLLIGCTALLNIAIDSISTRLRKKLKVSGTITSLG